MEVHVRIGRVVSRIRIFGYRLDVAVPINLELAAVPGEDLRLDAREGVGVLRT